MYGVSGMRVGLLGVTRVLPAVVMRFIVIALMFISAPEYLVHINSTPHLFSQYDFIVVGSGSAGSVVASRLAEIEGWNVLLLEAGGNVPAETFIPGLNVLGLQSEFDWNIFTTPQKYGLRGYVKNSCHMPVGKVIGGSTVLNWMMYVRGNRRDYDNWQRMGNPGWSYQDVLPYFKKAERYVGTRNVNTGFYHGRNGPLSVDDKRWSPPITEGILRAGRELGYQTIDPNGPEQIGFSIPDMTQRDGKRWSTAKAYLEPALRKYNNLHIVLHAFVTKILIDNHGRAIGVEYDHFGIRQRVYTKKEVILSAGAMNSPKILMLSGIGPRKHLHKHGIPVKIESPGVGRNLHDHPSIFGLTWTVNRGSATDSFRFISFSELYNYIRNRQGPLSVPFAVEVNAWMRSDGPDPGWPDLQFLFMSLTPAIDFGTFVTDGIGFRRDLYKQYYAPLAGVEGINIGPMLTRPKSRGTVKLQSRDPFKPPLVDPNFLQHPDDVALFIKGIKFAMAVCNTTALRVKHGARFYDKVLPGCEREIYGSDSYWECYTRHMAQTTYHPVGTCKMGPKQDAKAVVDHKLRVHGVHNLRVVDGSIMPLITSGNLNAPIIMIGEKAADFIKKDWGAPIPC